MKSAIERLRNVMTYTEINVAKTVIKEIGREDEKAVINCKIADKIGCTRSVIVTSLRIIEAAGVIETKSMGMKGTRIKVLDRDTLEQTLNM